MISIKAVLEALNETEASFRKSVNISPEQKDIIRRFVREVRDELDI